MAWTYPHSESVQTAAGNRGLDEIVEITLGILSRCLHHDRIAFNQLSLHVDAPYVKLHYYILRTQTAKMYLGSDPHR